jgi:hypothetical protein
VPDGVVSAHPTRDCAPAPSPGNLVEEDRRAGREVAEDDLILLLGQEPAEAEALAREAVSLTEGTEFPDWRADTLLDLAEVLRAAGRSEEANASARDALRLYEAKGNLASAEGVRALLA